MKRREWTISFGPYGGPIDEKARLQRTSGRWAIIVPPGLFSDLGPRNEAPTAESIEADQRALAALFAHIHNELKQRCPIRKDRDVKRGPEVMFREEACKGLGPYLPTLEARRWCEVAAALLEAVRKDPTLVTNSGQKVTSAAEVRKYIVSKETTHDERPKPQALNEQRKARADEWGKEEDASLVKWLSVRADGTRAPLKESWVAMMQKELPNRSMRSVRSRVSRLNRLLLLGLASGDPGRIPSCFMRVRLAMADGHTDVNTLYRRHALGANLRVRGTYKKRRVRNLGKRRPLRGEVESLRAEVADLKAQVVELTALIHRVN